ncbi:CocE/NonD family hydrolase [Streptomyces violaceusniger]|uniref:CocE/NonD family hydrolase n=1 Tax=Streptomyces violaceusniger TaxID=68280 RepID=UPI0036A42355
MTSPTRDGGSGATDGAAAAAWIAPSGRPPLAARMMRATWRSLPARRYEAGREADLEVPAADGSTLRADHYFPRAEGDFPTLLVRSPYGRGVPWSPMYGMLFAEQGFHVVLQSCRGTGGSGGEFDLWRNEAADGQATVAWLRDQPWFNGALGTIGPSYLGYVQWALALDPPPELRAMVVQVGLHDPHALFHRGGALQLENALLVGSGMTAQHRGFGPFVRATLRLRRHLKHITRALPLRGSYARGLGGELPWLDGVMSHPDAGDPFWKGASTGGAADGLRVPTCLISGWQDALVDQTFEQYGRLRRSGCDTSLLVGPWTHTSALQRGWPEVFAESLGWLRAHLCGDPSGLRPARVRVHIGGQGHWRDLDDWPPSPDTAPWYPAEGGRLTRQSPETSASLASFRYDPADPTPSIGGPLLSPTSGSRDNGDLEKRPDVLTFTGEPMAEPMDVLGPVAARLRISTDTGYADVFARLCDVDEQGRSVNVCDGLVRLPTGPGQPVAITVPMSSTAHRFLPGHRVRLQISGGAHPRYARNTGSGEPALDATTLTPVRITVHGASVLDLPVVGAER